LLDAAGGYWAPIALCVVLNLIAAAVVLRGVRGESAKGTPS
jgi:hypothetical protein